MNFRIWISIGHLCILDLNSFQIGSKEKGSIFLTDHAKISRSHQLGERDSTTYNAKQLWRNPAISPIWTPCQGTDWQRPESCKTYKLHTELIPDMALYKPLTCYPESDTIPFRSWGAGIECFPNVWLHMSYKRYHCMLSICSHQSTSKNLIPTPRLPSLYRGTWPKSPARGLVPASRLTSSFRRLWNPLLPLVHLVLLFIILLCLETCHPSINWTPLVFFMILRTAYIEPSL